MKSPDSALARACERALVAGARAQRAGTRQQVRAAARGFVRRHRRDRAYLRWVLRSAGASSALAVALLGLSAAPAGGEIAPMIQDGAVVEAGQNSTPALGDLDGDGDLDLVSGGVYGGFIYYDNSPMNSFVVAGTLDGQDVGFFSAPALGDLDADGDLDLVSGEQSGTFFYFENTGSATSPAFSPGLTPLPGQDVGSYSTPALGDLDGDGDLDLVAGGSGGFFYFENTGSATAAAFAAGEFNPLGLYYISGGTPALGDLDGDGDLDLVAGENFGGFFTFENTGNATSPAFAARAGAANPLSGQDVGATSTPTLGDLDADGDLDLVSGNFNYGFLISFTSLGGGLVRGGYVAGDVGFYSSPTLGDLDGDGDFDLVAGESSGNFHYFANTGGVTSPAFAAGTTSPGLQNVGIDSTPSLGDLDGDGDLDLVAGASDGTFHYFENTGSETNAAFIARAGAANPLAAEDVGSYSAPSLGDLDGDGDLDLVSGARLGTFFYYENTGSAASAVFVQRTSSANPFNGLDVNTDSAPALSDLDGDADLDLASGRHQSGVLLFENTGSATSPVFVPLLFAGSDPDSAPGLADLDGDGDVDLVAGSYFGDFVYFESLIAQSAEPAIEWIGAANPLDGQDVGNRAAPALADLDRDGDADLVAGEDLGTFRFFENIGSAIRAEFIPRTGAPNPLGGRDVGDRAQPAFGDVDGDGDLDLLVGRSAGDFHYFVNSGDAVMPQFAAAVANPFGLLAVGGDSAPAFADLDADGDLDLVVGQSAGLFSYFENTGSRTSPAFALRTGSANPLDGRDVGSSARPALGDFDGDGDADLVAGEGSGLFLYFENRNATIPVFGPLIGASNPLDGEDVGSDSAPAAADLNTDGIPELVTGSLAGTFAVHYFPEPARAPLLGAGIALLKLLERIRRSRDRGQ